MSEDKEHARLTEPRGLAVHSKPDGTWLEFKASDGKSAAFRIESVADDHRSGIIRMALNQWCLDRQADEAAITETGMTPRELAEQRAMLIEALREIAKQKTLSELNEEGEDCEGDFEGAYDSTIEKCRSALSRATSPQPVDMMAALRKALDAPQTEDE